jgi:hypothetical protein
MNRRRPISGFGRIYDYLKDVDLRLKEIGKKRITIEDAEFAGEEFINGYWGFYDFVNCHFAATHNITLIQLAECTFTECEFGPSRDDDSINFGKGRDSIFRKCKFFMANAGFTKGNARFEQCEFMNKNEDPNHSYAIGGVDLVFVDCKTKNYNMSIPGKLVLQDCTIARCRLSSRSSKNTPIIAEFTLADSTFENAEEILWGTKLKNFTMHRCVAEGPFRAQGLIVEEMALYEELTRGFFDFSGVGYHGKLRIQNCVFSTTGKRTKNNEEHVFVVNGAGAVDTLLENVVCRSDKSANLTGAYAVTVKEAFASEPLEPRNHLYVIRNCKIPYVQLNWVRSKHLRIENCEIGQLEMRDAQIGRLEIKNTKYERLDISRAIVGDYAIERLASGVIIDTGSNYDSATGKAKKK